MNNEELTNKQLQNLIDFLRKLGYTKEEFFHLENLKNILKPYYKKEELVSFGIESYFESLEEDWIEISKKSWGELIQHLIKQIDEISYGKGVGLEWLISKIALDLYNKFEKTISQGQAEAVIKRVLGINLSSTGRTQLYELRKKIRKYANFLAYFGDWAEKYDFLLKVVILGLNPKQATKLLQMSPLPETAGSRLTLGVEFYSKLIDISDTRVKLQLWDISMEEQHRSLLQYYCNGANGAILVYNKGDRESFELVKESYNELKKATDLKFGLSERRGTLVDMPIMFIGLGDDKNVTAEEGQSLLKELGAFGYIEFSETDTENFEKMLSSLSLGIITNYQNALKRSPRKFRFKVVVVGDANVGKTSLIQRFIKGSFDKDFVKTTGAQVSEHVVGMRGVKIMSLFWDIASAEIQKITEARQERIGLEIPQTKVEEDPNLLMQINEYLRSKLARAGFASVDVQKTSLGHRITIWANRPGIVIGKEGKRIQEITDVLQERFGLEMPQIEVDVIPGFFQNSTAAIIVCNLEEDNLGKDSLKQVSFWHNEIIKYCGNIPIVVIANKVDLIDEHKITKSKFQEFVNEKKILGYYIISVKTGQGVDEAFTRIIEALSDKIK